MRIIRFLDDSGTPRWGRETADGAVALDGEPLTGLKDTGERVAVATLLAPVEPVAILALGLNYRQHAKETGFDLPKSPILFMKNPASVQHPGGPIVLPKICDRGPEVDFELELAVLVGKRARDVAREDALDHVLGYTVANDVSARRWQKHGGAGQWVRSKSFDTFCPLGPALVTADEIPDPQDLRLTTRLNGELMQDANTADMIFSVADTIAELSRDMTLLPGTLILTGTPHGVGVARNPRVFLKPGDVLDLHIDRIGTLTNPVVAAE